MFKPWVWLLLAMVFLAVDAFDGVLAPNGATVLMIICLLAAMKATAGIGERNG